MHSQVSMHAEDCLLTACSAMPCWPTYLCTGSSRYGSGHSLLATQDSAPTACCAAGSGRSHSVCIEACCPVCQLHAEPYIRPLTAGSPGSLGDGLSVPLTPAGPLGPRVNGTSAPGKSRVPASGQSLQHIQGTLQVDCRSSGQQVSEFHSCHFAAIRSSAGRGANTSCTYVLQVMFHAVLCVAGAQAVGPTGAFQSSF